MLSVDRRPLQTDSLKSDGGVAGCAFCVFSFLRVAVDVMAMDAMAMDVMATTVMAWPWMPWPWMP